MNYDIVLYSEFTTNFVVRLVCFIVKSNNLQVIYFQYMKLKFITTEKENRRK
jgi:hypothetical protein